MKNKTEEIRQHEEQLINDKKELQSKLVLEESIRKEIAELLVSAKSDVTKVNGEIELLKSQKNDIASELDTVKKQKENTIEDYNNKLESFKKEIEVQNNTIEEKENTIKLKAKSVFYSKSKDIANLTKIEPTLLKHAMTFQMPDSEESKTKNTSIAIITKNSATQEQRKVAKLVCSTSSKMLAGTIKTTARASKLNKNINEAKQNMAALKILDSKLKSCFMRSCLEKESIDMFKRMVIVLESVYKIKLSNISFCVENCLQKQCCQSKQENSTQKEIVSLLQEYFSVPIELKSDVVDDFKVFLYSHVQ